MQWLSMVALFLLSSDNWRAMLLVSFSFKWKGPAGVLVSPSQTGDDMYSIVFVLCRGLIVRKTLHGSVDVKNNFKKENSKC
jgi:hypothetical protein